MYFLIVFSFKNEFKPLLLFCNYYYYYFVRIFSHEKDIYLLGFIKLAIFYLFKNTIQFNVSNILVYQLI